MLRRFNRFGRFSSFISSRRQPRVTPAPSRGQLAVARASAATVEGLEGRTLFAVNFAANNGIFPAGGNQSDVAVGTLNADGTDNDVAFARTGAGGPVIVQLSNGAGGYLPAVVLAQGAVAGTIQDIAIDDFDGDADDDIAILVEAGANDSIQVFKQLAPGTFSAATVSNLGDVNGTSMASAGDIAGAAGTGKEIVIGQVTAAGDAALRARVSTLTATGSGNFAISSTIFLSNSSVLVTDLEVADVAGNANPDVVAGTQGVVGIGTVEIARGQAGGGFGGAQTVINGAPNFLPFDIDLGNLDNQPGVDIAVGNGLIGSLAGVILATGAGTYPASITPVNAAPGFGPASVALGDFDLDGDLDLATANLGNNTVSVLANNGNGTFSSTAPPNGGIFGGVAGPVDMAVLDSNGDGQLDLVTANGAANGTLLLNALDTFKVADPAAVSESAGTVTFTVTRSDIPIFPSSVSFATANGTAIAGQDYTATSGTLTFNIGETSKTVTVPIINDAIGEGAEDFFLNLSSPTGLEPVTILDAQAKATINDDDVSPQSAVVSLDQAAISTNEGNAGFTVVNVPLNVVRSGPGTAVAVTLNYNLAAGTATAGSDFVVPGSTTVVIPAGTSGIVNVPIQIVGDVVVEGDEFFTVNLSSISGGGGTLGANTQTVVTIVDNDVAPSISIGNRSLTEGSGGGTKNFNFTVTRSGDLSAASTVNFTTADGTATAGGDYLAQAGTLNFAAGQSSKTITVKVNRDATFEADENFAVNLTSATNGTITDNQGLGTIENDDADAPAVLPSLLINDVSLAEGTGAGTKNFVFTVQRVGDTSQASSVDFTTVPGTAQDFGAVNIKDFTAVSGTLFFAANQTSATITVQVRRDGRFEGNETFNVVLSNATGATIGDGSGLGTILNDDSNLD